MTACLITTRVAEPEAGAYVGGFVSWERLADVLFRAGELKTGEHVTQFEADEHGVRFYVDKKEETSGTQI